MPPIIYGGHKQGFHGNNLLAHTL